MGWAAGEMPARMLRQPLTMAAAELDASPADAWWLRLVVASSEVGRKEGRAEELRVEHEELLDALCMSLTRRITEHQVAAPAAAPPAAGTTHAPRASSAGDSPCAVHRKLFPA